MTAKISMSYVATQLNSRPCTLHRTSSTCYVSIPSTRGPNSPNPFSGPAQLRASDPELAGRIRFAFVGTSNQPGAAGASATHRVTPIAREAGIADMVVETPERVPFIEALALQANAHVILMLGSDEPHYTASKIYPGMMSGRPFLSIFHQASSAHQILSASGGGAAFSFETLAELEAVKAKVTEALRELTQAPEKFPAIPPSAYARYSAHAVAGRFAGILDQLGHAPLQTRKRSL